MPGNQIGIQAAFYGFKAIRNPSMDRFGVENIKAADFLYVIGPSRLDFPKVIFAPHGFSSSRFFCTASNSTCVIGL
jgi:hypothetical protein